VLVHDHLRSDVVVVGIVLAHPLQQYLAWRLSFETGQQLVALSARNREEKPVRTEQSIAVNVLRRSRMLLPLVTDLR
jgi:hypothetical protein